MGRDFKVNKQGIRRHVRAIGKEYEKQWQRYGPALPIEGDEPVWASGPGVPRSDEPDPGSRIARIRRAFLLWFAGHDEEHPGWQKFLDECPEVDGVAVSDSERDEAVQRLLDDELLGGPGSRQQRWPVLLKLTAEGRLCVQDFGGDTVAWASRYRRGGSIYNDNRDQRVYAQGASGQVAAHSPGAHQEQHQSIFNVDIHALRSAARFLLANLEDLETEGFTPDSVEEVRAAAQNVVSEASEDEPEQSRLRGLAEKINTVLLTHPMTAGVASGGTSGTASALLAAALNPPQH
ncbi:hypothetical protein [Actinomycetospora aeridis]|uniref:Uncharacterized protein n=1 Tax=Actinomycetospora aeridis TaxID=3129231 RepID=A0ABU8NBA9_9PSEU